MMGTAKYLSPEQVRGRRLDGRADLYSLGLVLYECLAGRVPFLGETDADTALARLQRDPTDLGHLRPTLPIGLVNLIHKTLARNPAHRPQSGSDLRTALLSVDTTPPHIDGTPADPPPRIANPPTRALGAGPGIPGDPHVSAAVPVTRHTSTTRQQPSTAEAPPRRDDTPPAPEPIRGTPARRHQQRWTPSLIVVSTLLVTALVVAGVLFVRVNRGDDATDFTGTTVVPEVADTGNDSDDATPTGDAATPPGDGAAAADVTIVSIQAWDPDGSNGAENDAQASLALADNSSSTAWTTECYQDRYLGGKRGVGLIVDLSTASSGTLSMETLNAPYQIDVFAATTEGSPADLDAWDKVDSTHSGDEPSQVTATIDVAATHLLVWLRELGPDTACTSANPYRGRLGEISFQP